MKGKVLTAIFTLILLFSSLPVYGVTPGSPESALRVGLFYDSCAQNRYTIDSQDVFYVGLYIDSQAVPALYFERQELEVCDISSDGYTLLPLRYADIHSAYNYIKTLSEQAHLYFDGGWGIIIKKGDIAPVPFPVILIKGAADDMGIALPLSSDSPVVFESKGSGVNPLLKLNGKQYRGTIQMMPSSKGGITVVNQIGIEEYLYGVIPKEMSPSWPLEALKAQVVASRTYALKNLGRWKDFGFDLKADTGDQTYAGFDSETPLTNLAVNETKGQVMFYGGELITALYHADSGGITEACSEAFGSDIPYLVSVKDDYVKNTPNSKWELPVSLTEVSNRPEVSAKEIGILDSIAVSKISPAGRIKELTLIGNKGEIKLTYSQIRTVFSVKSNLFRVLPSHQSDADYIFEGAGYGHGVGMSQWGAKVMAEEGYNYSQILQHYYKNTQIEDPNILGVKSPDN